MRATDRFDGSVVLVTGAGGAIGSAAAHRFGDEGARLVLADIDRDRTEQVAARLRSAGIEATVTIGDLGADNQAEHAVSAAVEAYGRVDVVAAIAGLAGPRTPIHAFDVASWDNLLQSNLRSAFLTVRHASAVMVNRGIPGSLVLMSSSMAAWDVLDGGAAYAASKAAILALARSAAFDLAPHGIRVNAVCPGVVESGLGVPDAGDGVVSPTVEQFASRIPLGRVGQPEDVAAAVAFLASRDAAHVTGVGWLIDGGQTLQSWANAPRSSG